MESENMNLKENLSLLSKEKSNFEKKCSAVKLTYSILNKFNCDETKIWLSVLANS